MSENVSRAGIASLLFGALAIGFLAIAPSYYLSLAVVVGITAIAALGLVLLLTAGQISLGHAAYMGLGAYTSAVLARDYGLPVVLSALIAITATCAVAALIGWLTLRLKGPYLPLATLAVGIAFSTIFNAAGGITGGASGMGQIPPFRLAGLELTDPRAYAFVVWGTLLVLVVCLARMMRARQGRAIQTLRAHSDMASVFGVDVVRLRIAVFTLACGLAALAGVFYAHFFRFISPPPFALHASFSLLIAAVLGGSGHPIGAVIGALAVVVIETVLQNVAARSLGLSGHVEMIVFGMILVVLLLRWPGGIWSAIEARTSVSSTEPTRSENQQPPDTPARAAIGSAPLLEMHDVSVHFGGLQALSNVSLAISPKEIVGLIGPNGAGKSTAFNAMTGLIQPSNGSIQVNGKSLPRQSHRLISQGVARTFQHVKLVAGMSVFDNATIGAYSRGRSGIFAGMFGLDLQEEARSRAIAAAALQTVGLGDVLHQQAGSLPMGKQRLLEVARALVSQPELLLLDEPAAGLRTVEKVALLKVIHRMRRAGMSILLVEHDMELVMNGVDRLVVLDHGRLLAAGNPEDIRHNPKVIAAYLGT